MRTRFRGAFTVLEILISLALIAVMAAVLVPSLMTRVRDARTSALAQTLFTLGQALFEYKKAVTAYPPTLDLLSTKPLSTSTDACGVTQIGNTNANNWRGPYVSRVLVTGGVNIGDATISNTLRVQTGPPRILFIDVAAVEAASTTDLEAQFDGTTANPATTGAIQYTTAAIPATGVPAAPAGTFNVSYGIPISGC